MKNSFNITQAKAQLSAILAHIEKTGEAITITRAGKPVAELTAASERPSKIIIGAMQGKITFTENWDQWDEDEQRALGMID